MNMPIGVVGMGLLGRGITACLLAHGHPVVAVARAAERHAQALPIIDEMIGELVQRGAAPRALLDQCRLRLSQVTTWEPLTPCRFVIESVSDDLAVKQAVFDEIERVVANDAVIASNTSAIPISVLQQTRRVPQRFVGMHWAEPAHATRFLELIRGAATSDETVRRTEELARRLGKDPTVCCQDIPGFIVNRIGYALYREALHLVELGVADVETIDRSVRNTLGLWAACCGPFRWIDLTGGPALYARSMERVLPTLHNDAALPTLLKQLADQDARGIANGHGFYEYTPADAHIWEQRQRRHAWMVQEWLDTEFPVAPDPEPDGGM
jgi:3-hydroxybutyryl-CoA dehydrogenase